MMFVTPSIKWDHIGRVVLGETRGCTGKVVVFRVILSGFVKEASELLQAVHDVKDECIIFICNHVY